MSKSDQNNPEKNINPDDDQKKEDQHPQAQNQEQKPKPEPDKPFRQAVGPKGDETVSQSDKQERVSRYVLVVLLILVTLAFVPIIRFFLVPVVLAATFATLFYPFYRSILSLFRGKKGISSLVCCLILLLGLLVPTYIMAHLVVSQAIDFYEVAQPQVKEFLREGQNSQIIQQIRRLPFVDWLQLSRIDWQSAIQEAARVAASVGTLVINKTSASIFGLIANFFIILFTMFYFFMDGEVLVKRLKYLSPLRSEYEEMIFSRFLLISRATVKGTLLIGLIQGSLGAFALMIFGIDTWLLWGFVMVLLSIIPMVGAWLVMIPTGIVQIVLGNVWQGIGIIAFSTIIVSNIDNLIRPRIVGRGAKMHDLMIFFSTLGGIGVFGIMGFIVGPAIAALFITIVDIYGEEFQAQLTSMEEYDERSESN